jgi:hypothetical protein
MGRSRVLLWFICVVVLAFGSVAAVGADSWIKTFEGPDYGALFDVLLTEDGHILAVGATNHLHVGPYSGDALLMKLTLAGDTLWETTWGGEGYEQALSAVQAKEGGFLIFGETDSHGAGDRDFFLLKVAEDGTEEWFETYGGSRREWPYGVISLAGGDVLMYGFTTTDGDVRRQYAVRATSAGDVVWEYVAGEANEELILDALEMPAGELVLCVCIDEDGGLTKLDPDGGVIWSHRYELAGWQFPCQIAPTDDGGFLLAGFSMTESPRRQADTWLAEAASFGELMWETSFGNPVQDDYGQSLLPLQDGTFLIGGLGQGMPLVRVDEDGTVLWERSLTQRNVCAAEALIELDDGGFLVAGFIQIINGRSYDAILMRTDAVGQVAE